MEAALRRMLCGARPAHLLLFLFCILQFCGQVPASPFLPGSCIAAGFTSCCQPDSTPSCGGEPHGTCFCDASCYEFDDCCEDIDTICSNSNATDKQPPSRIFFTVATDVTFHSANILWGHNYSDTVTQFTVQYHEPTLPSVVFTANDSSLLSPPALHSLTLTHLSPGSLYQYRIIASTSFGSEESEEANLTTLHLPTIREVHASSISSSEVEVSWAVLNLPPGASVSKYTVHYSSTGRSAEKSKVFPSTATCHKVGELDSHLVYVFQISYTLMTPDDVIIEGPVSNSSTVFVPESALVQLGGRGSLPVCRHWSETTEREVKAFFRSQILQAISSHCPQCQQYPQGHIDNEIVLCSVMSSDSIFVVYRARLLSTEELRVRDIAGFVEEWILHTHTQQVVIAGSTADVTLNQECPVLLPLQSASLCIPQSDTPSLTCDQTACASGATGVSISVLAASLAAELLLCLVVFLGVSGTVIVLKKNKMCKQEAVMSSEEAVTSSVEHRTTTGTVATKPQDEEETKFD